MQPQDTMLRCSRCREAKPPSAFHRNKRHSTGYMSHCKACDTIRAHVYYLANKAKLKEKSAKKYAANREKYAARWARWYAENQPLRAKSEAARAVQWSRDHAEAARIISRAGNAVQRAMKRGTLVRPDACEECGRACKPQGAHSDYTRPLDVRWLCRSCHSRWDMAEPKTASLRGHQLGNPTPVTS
jgi:hypothetical protein